MDADQIIEALKANSDVSFEDARKQASEAGVGEKDFLDAWRRTHKEFHDKRVLELMNEIDNSETADKASQKLHAKEKGYLDDEFDLAYCLKGVKLRKGPFPIWISVILLLLLGFGIDVGLVRLGAEGQMLIAGFVPVGAYVIWLFAQKKKYFFKVLSLDFEAKVLKRKELGDLLKKLKDELGSIYLKTTRGGFYQGLRMIYDNRPTYYLDYTYSIGSGKNRVTYHHTLVIQEHKHTFPNAFCYDNTTRIPISLFKENVKLEGTDFNKEYKVYVADDNKKVDAFYVLNPRVMAKMLEPEVKKYLRAFETVGSMLIVGMINCPIGMSVRSRPPIVTYDEYRNAKDEILKRLDIATDVTDVLMREIVDKGEKRSIAKEL